MTCKYGTVNYEPAEAAVGSYATWSLCYTAGETEIKPGGQLRIAILGKFCFGNLQANNRLKENYITVRCRNNPAIKLSLPHDRIRNGSQYWELTVVVENEPLKSGDTIEVVFGDRSQGGPGFNLRRHAQKLRFYLWVDPRGENDFHQVPDVPAFPVIPDNPVRLEILAPSKIMPKVAFRSIMRYVDRFGNIVDPAVVLGPGWANGQNSLHIKVTTINEEESATLKPVNLRWQPTGANTIEICTAVDENKDLQLEQFIKIKVQDEQGFTGVSNPILLTAVNDSVPYWGEIHGHTLLSDGQLLPDEYFRYARERERLDFSAICDHDTHMMRREIGGEDRYLYFPYWDEPLAPWNIIKYETERFNEPGVFVTFLGYEWTSGHCFTPKDLLFGHRNVYYLTSDERVYSHIDVESDTPYKLFQRLEGKDAMVIPHHSARPVRCKNDTTVDSIVSGVDWQFHDGRWERVVEIYSKWGNSETDNGPRPVIDAQPEGTVQQALSMGCRLGFVGGSDTHAAWPGSSVIEEGGLLPYSSGLTCVWATALNRQELFSAIFKRKCYATTGPRIFIEFFVNGKPMGEEIILSPEEHAQIKARVAFVSKSGMVEIIRNNKIVASFTGEREINIKWTDPTPVKEHLLKPSYRRNDGCLFTYYYLRVIQDDKEMAWASPVWFINKGGE